MSPATTRGRVSESGRFVCITPLSIIIQCSLSVWTDMGDPSPGDKQTVPQWPSQDHKNQGQDAIPSYQASFESVPVSCLTPVPWGQQTNRVCLPVSSDVPPDTLSLDWVQPFILNDISSSEMTKVTSDHDGLGGWGGDGWCFFWPRHYWLPEWNGVETGLARTQDTSSLLSRMSGLNTP